MYEYELYVSCAHANNNSKRINFNTLQQRNKLQKWLILLQQPKYAKWNLLIQIMQCAEN